MSPAQLPDHVIPVVEEVTDFDRVVSALAVVRRRLLLVIIRPQDLLLLVIVILNIRWSEKCESVRQTTP